MEENINIIIRSICQDLYENLRHNSSAFSKIKSKKYLTKLKKINFDTDYRFIDVIRDELGLVYKNYIVFCQKKEYENNAKILNNIKKMYIDISYKLEQIMLGNTIKNPYTESKNLEKYIKELELTYGGQTEKYLKKLSKKRLGNERKKICQIYKDKSKIISTKKDIVISLLKNKLNRCNYIYEENKKIKIVYNSEIAEYMFTEVNNDEQLKKKKYKFKTKFSDIEELQKNALKNLKKINFGISINEELKLNENCIKYVDPFILTIFIEEGYLDYAKIYLRQLNGEIKNQNTQLLFKIIYKIDNNFENGILTPLRNKIIAIIAERGATTVAEVEILKNNK